MNQPRVFGKRVCVGAVVLVVAVAAFATRSLWLPLLSGGTGQAETSSAAPQATGGTNKGNVPVIVAPVGETSDTVVIEAIGTARAMRSVMLYPDASGEITALPVETGGHVDKGDEVMHLDDHKARLAVQVAEAHVRVAQVALDRTKSLQQSRVKSVANVEDAQLTLELARLERRQAQADLADHSLRAPFSGYLGIPKFDVGDRVTTSSAIVSLDDRSTLIVEFEVAERYFNRLKVGMTVSAQTPAFGGRVITGVIDKIDSRVDPTVRTALIRAAFQNAADDLRPGMSFATTLDLPGPVLPSMPELALQWDNGASYVWRIASGKAERVPVTLKRRLNNTVLVEGDLKPGEMIVVEGVQRLRPGREVSIAQGAAQRDQNAAGASGG